MYDWQNELTAINSELIAAETRPEKTQSRISANQTRANELNEQLRQLQRQAGSQLNRARERAIQAELEQLELANALLRRQLSAAAAGGAEPDPARGRRGAGRQRRHAPPPARA